MALGGGESTPAGSPECEEDALFESGFENGFEDWNHRQALPGRATIKHGASFCGDAHARFEVLPGDVEPETGSNRAEVTGPTYSEGDDLWYRQATRLGDDFPDEDEFQIVSQWKSGDGSPPVALFVEDDASLVLRRGDEPFTEFWRGPATTGVWIDLIVHIKFSEDPSEGFVEVWRDGHRQTMENGEERIYGETIDGDTGYVKLGYYRASSHEAPGVVFHDGFRVGASLADVAPAL